MSRIRLLWDCLTGQEAERLAARCEALRKSDRDNHAREVQQLRLAALDQGVWLSKAVDNWVDVTTADGGERWIPGTYQWQAEPVHESNVEVARNLLLGSEGTG